MELMKFMLARYDVLHNGNIMNKKCQNAELILFLFFQCFTPMANCAKEVIALNNPNSKIKVIPKRSNELTVGDNGDLPHKANILVTEVFDTELIGEGAISTFNHAHIHLLEVISIRYNKFL